MFRPLFLIPCTLVFISSHCCVSSGKVGVCVFFPLGIGLPVLSFHQKEFRVCNPLSADPRGVPDIIVHAFYKNWTLPTVSEGFAEVCVLPTGVRPTFSSPLEAFLFTGYLE